MNNEDLLYVSFISVFFVFVFFWQEWRQACKKACFSNPNGSHLTVHRTMGLNMCSKNVINIKFVAIRCVLSSSKCAKTCFQSGLLSPDTPDTPGPAVGWGHGRLPISFRSTPSESRFLGPLQRKFLATCMLRLSWSMK